MLLFFLAEKLTPLREKEAEGAAAVARVTPPHRMVGEVPTRGASPHRLMGEVPTRGASPHRMVGEVPTRVIAY